MWLKSLLHYAIPAIFCDYYLSDCTRWSQWDFCTRLCDNVFFMSDNMTKIVTKFYSSGTLQFLATLHMFVALQLESIKIGSPFHNSKYTLGTERLCANYLGTQLEAVINTLFPYPVPFSCPRSHYAFQDHGSQLTTKDCTLWSANCVCNSKIRPKISEVKEKREKIGWIIIIISTEIIMIISALIAQPYSPPACTAPG